MAAADTVDDTASVDTETGQPTAATDTTVDTSTADAPGASAASAAADADQATQDAAADKSGEDEGKGSDASKERNRAGFLARQITQRNEKIGTMRQNLQTWVDDAGDDTTREIRESKAERYLDKVERTQETIRYDNEQVVREIPLFNAGSQEFNEQLTKRALDQYARDCLETDDAGNIVGYKIRLLDYMREKADDYSALSKAPGSQDKPKSKQLAKAEMDAKADTPGGTSPDGRKTKGEDDDPFMAGFNDPYGRHTPSSKHAWTKS